MRELFNDSLVPEKKVFLKELVWMNDLMTH